MLGAQSTKKAHLKDPEDVAEEEISVADPSCIDPGAVTYIPVKPCKLGNIPFGRNNLVHENGGREEHYVPEDKRESSDVDCGDSGTGEDNLDDEPVEGSPIQMRNYGGRLRHLPPDKYTGRAIPDSITT